MILNNQLKSHRWSHSNAFFSLFLPSQFSVDLLGGSPWHQRNLKLHYCCVGGTLWRVWWGWGSLVYFWFLWEVAQLFCLEACSWASRFLPFSSSCTWDLHFHSFTSQRDLQKTLRTQAGNSFPWAKSNSGKLQEHVQQQCSPWPSERALLLHGARETKKRDRKTFPQIKNHSLSVLVLKPVLFVRSYLTFANRLLFLSAWKITEILTHC